ncbi:hypothetical protein [Microseira sp. BLCC-F43]|uniref:hypothetical protein n=1 Tax=Microseira sp. BLCC-F43 TaxID=3153602 RepID=UPI0035BA63CB
MVKRVRAEIIVGSRRDLIHIDAQTPLGVVRRRAHPLNGYAATPHMVEMVRYTGLTHPTYRDVA